MPRRCAPRRGATCAGTACTRAGRRLAAVAVQLGQLLNLGCNGSNRVSKKHQIASGLHCGRGARSGSCLGSWGAAQDSRNGAVSCPQAS